MIDLSDRTAVDEYVVTHIDEAIKSEWIKVYYQPVIRSLTGQLCGAESLARWIDPEVGFLAPDKFIGALERANLIHKLDCYIVERVCRDIHESLVRGVAAFPVSVNFSRLDFVMCDMLELVENTMEKYGVPRDYIHVEITESMVMSDETLMSRIVEEFRGRGYEIWMDDFGSGYSSLNVLKDYQFDLLKVDMRFLQSMTERSKTIVRSTIKLAKNLGIKTLTEGVETQEQVEFLKEIGCGKQQGYFFGKPEPLDVLHESLKKKNITIEERKWRSYYETASFYANGDDIPLAIMEFDGKHFKTLYVNDEFKRQIYLNIEDLSVFDSVLYNPTSPLYIKLVQFAEKIVQCRNIESFYFTEKGNYFFLKAQCLDENEGRFLLRTTVTNITHNQNTKDKERLDSRVRELNHLFEVVVQVNIVAKTLYPLLGGYRYTENIGETRFSLEEKTVSFAKGFVHPDERDAFIEFLDYSTIKKRVEESGRGFIVKAFRIMQKDGSYEWRLFSILNIPGTNGNEYLSAIGILPKEIQEVMDKNVYENIGYAGISADEITLEYARIWQNVVRNGHQMFFWKDMDRKFRGVSKSFLDFYELKSMDDIIGKNDEEMHWHLDDGPYKGDELDVLGKGSEVFNAPGQCIVNGVVHNIICNKIPIYDNGKIVGLVGSFADVDQELFRVEKLVNPSKLDTMTRLMNNRAVLDTLVEYAAQYNDAGRNYGVIVLHDIYHKRIFEDFGEKFAVKVIREMGEKIISCIGQSAAAGRTKEAYFCVITYQDSKDKLEEIAQNLKKSMESINEVDGRSVTIRITVGMRMRTDEGITDENIYIEALGEVDKQEIKNYI